MSAHTVLQRHLNEMQVIADQREKRQIVEFLVPLTRRLDELIRIALQFRMKRKIWREVFQRQEIVGYDGLWGELRAFSSRLEPPEVALSISIDEINQLAENALALTQATTTLDRELDKEWSKWRQSILEQVELVSALLLIPDLFSGEQERHQIEVLLQEIALFLGQAPKTIIEAGIDGQAHRWEGLFVRFSEIQGRLSFNAIGDEYGLSPETVEVIHQLVARKALTLDRVSSRTLDELSRFARFRSLVRLSFVPQPNRS